jgi:hypothetical protein
MTKLDALFDEGIPLGEDLVAKATLRVPVRKMRFDVAQSLVDGLVDVYDARMQAMLRDIEEALNEDEDVVKSDAPVKLVFSGGRLLMKATGPQQPKQPTQPKLPPKTVNASGERVLTADGYHKVIDAGSKGGKFWIDARGNVRYGERPTPTHPNPATPEQVVGHFQQYYAPQNTFMGHEHQHINDAILESDVVTDADRQFMMWWEDNFFDGFLASFTQANGKPMTKDSVDKAGGLRNVQFRVDDREVSVEEAVEIFFRTNADLFVGDEDFGNLESEEDVLKAVRGTMHRYQKAMTEDAKVKAAIVAQTEKHEIAHNAFFIKAETMDEEYQPLTPDLLTGNDFNDLGLRFTIAALQLGVIERGTGGKVAKKRARGALIPTTPVIHKDGAGSIWRKDSPLDRLNSAQLATAYLAERLQHCFNSKTTEYNYLPPEAGKFASKESERCFQELADRLDMHDPVQREALRERMENTASAMAASFNNYNKCHDPGLGEALNMKVKDVAGKDDVLTEFRKKAADRAKFIEEVLAAQEDTSFTLPPTMANGSWNGKTLKDKDNPEKGVWAPFEYQKKYVNWMLKVKRGIIAADAGLGKTPSVITLMETLRAQGKDMPALCFLPPSLMEQWPQEIEKFAPEMKDKILNLNGLTLKERKRLLQSPQAKEARYILMSTGTLSADKPDPTATEEENDGTGGTDNELVEILRNMEGAVFVDEAHSGGYKKEGNARFELAKQILEGREYAFGMTATPIPDKPKDVFHLADLFAPGSVGDKDLWEGAFADVDFDEDEGKWTVTNPERLADLNKRLKPYVMYKSIQDEEIEKDIGKALPQKQGFHALREEWPIEGQLNVSEYKEAHKNGRSQHDYFKKGGVIDMMVKLRINQLIKERDAKVKAGEIDPKTKQPIKPYNMKTLERVAGGMKITLHRQASISPALIDPSFQRHDGGVAHSPKLKALADDIEAHFANGGQGGNDAKPMVVFCSYPGKAFPLVKQMLAERGIDPSRIESIAGDVAPAERNYMQTKINAGHCKVLLVGTQSGGAGLNLQDAANKVMFLDEPWSPAAKRQAQGRVWRTGQKNVVYEKTLRTSGTLDWMPELKLAGKQTMATALLSKELPTAETFSPEHAVTQLTGRMRGINFNEDEIKKIMENASKYDIEGDEHAESVEALDDEQWRSVLAAGGQGGRGAQLTEEHFKPSEAGQKRLKGKGAGVLTEAFDEKEFRASWEAKRDERNALRDKNVAELMIEAAKQDGNEEEVEQYTAKLERLKDRFPHVFGLPPKKAKGEKEPGEPEKASTPNPEKVQKPVREKNEKKAEKEAAAKKPKGGDEEAAPAPKKGKEKAAKPEPEKETTKPAKTKPEPEKPAKGKAPEKKAPARKVVHTNKFGLKFHDKEHSFTEGSGKKVKGTDISHAEAAHFFDLLKTSKHKSLDDFADDAVKAVWDNSDGKYTTKRGREYMQKVIAALQSAGHVAGEEN